MHSLQREVEIRLEAEAIRTAVGQALHEEEWLKVVRQKSTASEVLL